MVSASAKKGRLRLALAILLALDFLVVYATPLGFEVVHEWSGILAFVLVIVHVVINRRWFTALFKGKYGPLRIVSTILVIAMVVCILGPAVSSLIISRHAFGFLPAIPGSSWARVVHLACSSWLLILAFVHGGLHLRLGPSAKSGKLALRLWYAALAIVAIGGIVSLIALGIPDYLFLQRQFYYGWDGPLWQSVLLYVVVAIGLACLGRLLSLVLRTVARK